MASSSLIAQSSLVVVGGGGGGAAAATTSSSNTYKTTLIYNNINHNNNNNKKVVVGLGHVKGGDKWGHNRRIGLITRIRASSSEEAQSTMAEKAGIKIINNPPDSKLSELGVKSWPKWGCPPSKFPWTYSAKETCYLLKGKVKVYPDGSDEAVEIGSGDLVVFPKGMSCTWDVSEEVDKHYNFE